MARSSRAGCAELDASFASFLSWENVVFGYSTYQTDGHFVGGEEPEEEGATGFPTETAAVERDGFRKGRMGNYWRETTLVIKFILTNYATVVQPRDQCLEAMVSESTVGAQNEHIMAGLHLRDVGDYIVEAIERGVLWNEEEVWAHSWYTVLDRRCIAKRYPPIVLSTSAKSKRFLGRSGRVLCVIDYIDETSLKQLKGDGWAASRDGIRLADSAEPH